MKKGILALAVAGALATVAVAQDLDTTSIADQFSTGTRGNAAGTGGGFGASLVDGSENADYSGADATGTIRYINAYAGASAGDATNGESPVLAVTNVGNPDRSLLGNTIPANTRPGATSASDVILISDDGGQNTLLFGQSDDSNYFVEVDVYCYNRSSIAGQEWAMVGLRTNRDDTVNANVNGGAYNIDREAGFAIVYDYHTQDVNATTFVDNNAAFALGTVHGTITDIAEGWHTFRIEANGTTVTFIVDGTQLGQATSVTTLTGRGAIGYREASVASADERAGTFDNLKAGPSSSSVDNWSVYQY